MDKKCEEKKVKKFLNEREFVRREGVSHSSNQITAKRRTTDLQSLFYVLALLAIFQLVLRLVLVFLLALFLVHVFFIFVTFLLVLVLVVLLLLAILFSRFLSFLLLRWELEGFRLFWFWWTSETVNILVQLSTTSCISTSYTRITVTAILWLLLLLSFLLVIIIF